MKSRIRRVLSITLMAALLFFVMPVEGDSQHDGWISITVGNRNSKFDRNNISFGIYLVARGDYGDWTMLDQFNDIKVFTRDDGSTYINKSMNQIKQRIRDLSIRATMTGKTDRNGKVEFKNLERGIYYVVMTDGPEYLTVQQMLLSAPNKEGSVQIRAVAKLNYNPPPSPTPTQKPTPTPFPTLTPGITANPTPTPVATPSPTPDINKTPVPEHVPTQTPRPGETPVSIEDYETALGLGNIQMHVGVCFE